MFQCRGVSENELQGHEQQDGVFWLRQGCHLSHQYHNISWRAASIMFSGCVAQVQHHIHTEESPEEEWRQAIVKALLEWFHA
eukprot:3213089-Amphidinium_carterae.1